MQTKRPLRALRSLRLLPCALVLLAVALFALFPDFFAPDALSLDIKGVKLPPGSPGHPLGTDAVGRDVLKFTIYGARNAMLGPLCIATGSLLLGLLLGGVSGWCGGLPDKLIAAYTDITLAMPATLLAIAAAAIIGGGYWVNVAVMIVLYSPFDIRLVRSAVLQQKAKPYIESTRMLNLSAMRVLARHIFPNIAMLVLVNYFLNISSGLMSMSSLSFLGLGVAPGQADWGLQLSDGRRLLSQNPALAISACVMIIATAVSINLIGSGLLERAGVDE